MEYDIERLKVDPDYWPEGAEYYVTPKSNNLENKAFFAETWLDEDYLAFSGKALGGSFYQCSKDYWNTPIKKPSAHTTWPEGTLPPVGTKCLAEHITLNMYGEDVVEYIEVEVIAHAQDNAAEVAVYKYHTPTNLGGEKLQVKFKIAECFKPIISKEEAWKQKVSEITGGILGADGDVVSKLYQAAVNGDLDVGGGE